MRAAIILSGCGVLDGSEVHESVLMLLALAEAGHSTTCFAPDKKQKLVINHLTKKHEQQERNVLAEAARIARGEISDVRKLKAADFDLLCMPGGEGAKSNLLHDPEVERVIQEFYAAKKPIVAACMSPLVVATALKGKGIEMTMGRDPANMQLLKDLGMKPKACTVEEIVADVAHKVYTAPAYFEPPSIKGVYASFKKIMAKL